MTRRKYNLAVQPDSDEMRLARRPVNSRFNSKYVTPTVSDAWK